MGLTDSISRVGSIVEQVSVRSGADEYDKSRCSRIIHFVDQEKVSADVAFAIA